MDPTMNQCYNEVQRTLITLCSTDWHSRWPRSPQIFHLFFKINRSASQFVTFETIYFDWDLKQNQLVNMKHRWNSRTTGPTYVPDPRPRSGMLLVQCLNCTTWSGWVRLHLPRNPEICMVGELGCGGWCSFGEVGDQLKKWGSSQEVGADSQ